MKKNSLVVLTQCAILVALAVVARSFLSPIIHWGGIQARVNVWQIFAQMTSVLFGPGWGGISSASINILNLFMSTQGIWLWQIMVLDIGAAILLGVLWKFVKCQNSFVRLLIVVSIVDIIYTVINTWILSLFISSMQGVPFLIMLVPRIIVALGFIVPKVYVMKRVLTLYEKHTGKRGVRHQNSNN